MPLLVNICIVKIRLPRRLAAGRLLVLAVRRRTCSETCFLPCWRHLREKGPLSLLNSLMTGLPPSISTPPPYEVHRETAAAHRQPRRPLRRMI